MKNVPDKIYLQIGEADKTCDDFNELSDVTLSAERINDNDIKYCIQRTSSGGV